MVGSLFSFILSLQTFDSLYAVSEERPGVANILARQICKVTCIDDRPIPWLYSIIVRLAMYGPIHNKAHR